MTFLHLIVALSLNVVAAFQSEVCSDVCPPVNRFNVPINSLCTGDTVEDKDSAVVYKSCFGRIGEFKLSDFEGETRAIVISNYFYASHAAKRESGVFAHVAQKLRNKFKDNVVFISGNKGVSCRKFADKMADDAEMLYPEFRPSTMPLVVHDTDSMLRDLLFTPPFSYPSYVVLDGDLKLRHKITGPCCGKLNGECKYKIFADDLESQLTELVRDVLFSLAKNETKTGSLSPTPKPTPKPTTPKPTTPKPTAEPTETPEPSTSPNPTSAAPTEEICSVEEWSDWSGCSIACGLEGSGTEFRWRIVMDLRDPYADTTITPCPPYIETRPCTPLEPVCNQTCTKETGDDSYNITVISEGFDGPRDIAFHPTPGLHLTRYSEGRKFYKGNIGDGEAWVVNGHNHSVSIVSAVRSEEQTMISRRDRAYYHNLIDATAISFNSVENSGRDKQRDGYRYWSVCNDNSNSYLGKKKPNYFMGPTLFHSDPENSNTVNRLGSRCKRFDQCNFESADKLHEAPECIGIAHDPELKTAHGNVYWAFDATGNKENGQLVRFDFQQPHGPGSEDHSIASVRRYPEVKLNRASGAHVHAGIVVHPSRREIFIADAGSGNIIVVKADSASYARSARSEYPVFSNRLPTFDYSIWECVDQRVFASNLTMPSGMALSRDGERLYVAEHDSGLITAYEVASGTILHTIETNSTSIEGMAIAPNSDTLYFVDSGANTLNAVIRNATCVTSEPTRVPENYTAALLAAQAEFDLNNLGEFYVYRDNSCMVDTEKQDKVYFDIPDPTGFASYDHNVQGPVRDETAVELATRKDCSKKSDLNFDQLLLGGYFCHKCLPNNDDICDDGGTCTNVQWEGYTCDNHFIINSNNMLLYDAQRVQVNATSFKLDPNVTYRFEIAGQNELYLSMFAKKPTPLGYLGNPTGTARRGAFLFKPFDLEKHAHTIYVRAVHKAKLKLNIDFPCEDRNMTYKGDVNKGCDWVSGTPRRQRRLCYDNKRKWIRRTCPKTCETC